jgi:hypothetical protein
MMKTIWPMQFNIPRPRPRRVGLALVVLLTVAGIAAAWWGIR